MPLTSDAFKQGDLSYSKVRAMSRVATPATEEQLVDFAIYATASQVDRRCMDLRNMQRNDSTKDANRMHDSRYLSCSPHGDGSVTLSVELPKETADLVMKALQTAGSQMDGKDEYEDEESESSNARGGHPPRGALASFAFGLCINQMPGVSADTHCRLQFCARSSLSDSRRRPVELASDGGRSCSAMLKSN